jgi:hypothetical protein
MCMMNRNDEKGSRGPRSGRLAWFGRFAGMMFMRICFVAVFALVLAVVVMWLWNLLLPGLFGIGEIGFWQAFGLMILARLLLGTIGPGSRAHPWHARPPWSDRFKHNRDWCGDMGRPEHMQNTMRWWKNYKEFWRDEGKASFDEYLKKKKEDAGEKKTKA